MPLSNKLLGQSYVKERLKSSLKKLYGRYAHIICIMNYFALTLVPGHGASLGLWRFTAQIPAG